MAKSLVDEYLRKGLFGSPGIGKSETVKKSKLVKKALKKKGVSVKNVKVPKVSAKDLKGSVTNNGEQAIKLKKKITLYWISHKGFTPDCAEGIDFTSEFAKSWLATLNQFNGSKVLKAKSWNDTMKSNGLDIPYPESLVEKTSKCVIEEPEKPKVPEPDYKAWNLLLLRKIKEHNEDIKFYKDKKGISSGFSPFMGPIIHFDNSPREITLPDEIKNWQEKEQESTEEGRLKIGECALRKLSAQERKILNLNRPFKVIDGEYFLNKVRVEKTEVVMKEKKDELKEMDKLLYENRHDRSKATQELIKTRGEKREDLHKMKEDYERNNKYSNTYFC